MSSMFWTWAELNQFFIKSYKWTLFFPPMKEQIQNILYFKYQFKKMDAKVWIVAKKINGYIQWEFLFHLSTKQYNTL